MLTLYRRHRIAGGADNLGCPKKKDRYWKRCTCPMWVEGVSDQGVYIRRSLKTTSWERALKLTESVDEPDRTSVTVEHAVKEFLQDLQAQGLTQLHIVRQRRFALGFAAWCRRENYRYLKEIDASALRTFRSTWEKNKASSRKLKQSRVKQFFNFCSKAKWITSNPASELSTIKVNQVPTDYLRRDEFEQLLSSSHGRVRAFVLLLRWSGLRISDAATLTKDRIRNGELLLYTAKTGQPVFVPLPKVALAALEELPGKSPYFFWTGKSDVQTVTGDWREKFNNAVKVSGLEKRCHPHMLRDTFAVEMLLAGVPLDQVSILLGHSSVKVTEKHYSPFVKARQDQLTESVKKAWG